jgi:uncharacterized protein (DUF111 family)
VTRILYFDASAGASGDMFVGALLDLGASLDRVRADVACLGVEGIELRARKVARHGITGTKFDVLDPATHAPVDGITEDAGGGHRHHHHGPGSASGADTHPHGHGHEHTHEHAALHRHAEHGHRGIGEIRNLIAASRLPEAVAADALAVFGLLARAEAKVHGVSLEDVHFHEVGALDAIADVVAASSAIHQIGPEETWCSPVHVGCGTVHCDHGVLPVPAPATAEILRGVPVYSDGTRGELTTPTGAALLKHFCDGFAPMPPLVVEAVGYGAGTKDFGIPNLLRATAGRRFSATNPLHLARSG